jgi:hypothetical protein
MLAPRFSSWAKRDAWNNATAAPARADELCVLAAQTVPFPHRRALRQEMIAFVERENARYAREHGNG